MLMAPHNQMGFVSERRIDHVATRPMSNSAIQVRMSLRDQLLHGGDWPTGFGARE